VPVMAVDVDSMLVSLHTFGNKAATLSSAKARLLLPVGLCLWGVEQLFNALTILIANLYVYQASFWYLETTSQAFAPYVTIIRNVALMHCPCSFIYHLDLTRRSWQMGAKVSCCTSGTRCLDMGAIHLCCICISWALSHGSVPFFALNFLVNAYCLHRMICRWWCNESREPECEKREYARLGICVLMYPTAIALRGDAIGFLEASFWIVLMCLLQHAEPFGHGASRAPLAVFMCCLMRSAASA